MMRRRPGTVPDTAATGDPNLHRLGNGPGSAVQYFVPHRVRGTSAI